MNWDRLKLVSGPAQAPLTREAAKLHCAIEADDREYDTAVDEAIAAAVAMIDGPKGIGYAMVEQTWRLSLDGFREPHVPRCGWPLGIAIPLGPVSAIVSVKYTDQSGAIVTMDPAAYSLDADQDPAILTPAFGTAWPLTARVPGAVKIEFKAGAAAAAGVPADLISALKLIVGHLVANREAVAVLAAGSVATLPLGVQSIFDRYGMGGAV